MRSQEYTDKLHAMKMEVILTGLKALLELRAMELSAYKKDRLTGLINGLFSKKSEFSIYEDLAAEAKQAFEDFARRESQCVYQV